MFLTVPDDEIADVAAGLAALEVWRPGQIVIHCSGRHGLAVLDAAAARGAIPMAIHPAMTFTGTSLDLDRLVGATFAVTAPGAFLPIAQALVVEMGGEPLSLEDAARPLYHAALVHGGNHVVTLVTQAAALLAAAGVEEPGRVLLPLVHASVEGALTDAAGARDDAHRPRREGRCGHCGRARGGARRIDPRRFTRTGPWPSPPLILHCQGGALDPCNTPTSSSP